MLWKVLRPRLWMLDRRVRAANRAGVALIILLVGVGGQWAYVHLIQPNLALLGSEQVATLLASSLPLALFLLLIFALLGVGDLIQQLYLTTEVELLLVAPVPTRTIFLVKLLQGSRATFLPALGVGAFWLAVGWTRGAPPGTYFLLVLLLGAAIVLTTVLVMILVILLARLLPPQRVRSWMPLLLGVATLALSLVQQPAARWFAAHTDLLATLARALLDPLQLAPLAAGLGALALGATWGAYRLFDTAFHEGWDRLHAVPAGPRPLPAAARRPGLSRVVLPRLVPPPLRALLVKEWLATRRDPRGLLNLAQPLILVLVVVIIPLLTSGGGGEALRPLLFLFLLLLMALMLGILPVGSSLLAVAEEGPRLALLRTLPVSMSTLLQAKLWATYLPAAAAWAVVLLAAGLWLRFPAWQIALLIGVAAWGLAGASAATVALGGLQIDFQAGELPQRIPRLTSYLVMGLNVLFVVLAVATGLWLSTHLAPDSPFVQALHALAGFRLVAWFLEPGPWVPLVLAGAQIAYGLGLRGLWAAAVRRLEAWEAV